MSLHDDITKKFQELFQKEHNQEISKEEAAEYAHNLIAFADRMIDRYINEKN